MAPEALHTIGQIRLRLYERADFGMISDWWQASGEVGPLETMLPLDSSFVLELDGRAILAVSLYLLNIPECAWVENFIGSPRAGRAERRACTPVLLEFLEAFARSRGYRSLICMASHPRLEEYYRELGFAETVRVTCFRKGVQSCPQPL